MIRTCQFIHHGVTHDNLKINSTSSRAVSIAGWANHKGQCQGGYYSDQYGEWWDVQVTAQYDITLMQAYGTIYREENTLITNLGVKCIFSDGYCFDVHPGEVIWETTPSNEWDTRKFSVLYEGPGKHIQRNRLGSTIVDDKLLTVEEGGTTFALKIMSPIHICFQKAFSTEHPKLLLIIGAPGQLFSQKKSYW
jgi:hypothetical protein